ncbi:MAG: FAD:protein FMN transferase [Gammaproteobacteria bacterium]|jgi:thiamine biosynthesis lipoprotein
MANHRRFIYLALVLFAAALLYWRSLQGPSADMVTLAGKTMGTSYSVTIPAPHASNGLADSIEQRLEELENIFSTWRDDSEISRFNASRSTDWFSCSRELAEVVIESIRMHALTEGAFEITLGPLIERWGFDEARVTTPPSEVELSTLMRSVGTENLEARESPAAIRKRLPDTSLNLSGIAKGYAVDIIAELLEQQGLDLYMVEIGGEIRTKSGSGDRPWRIAIAKPQPGKPQAESIVGVGTAAIATSGGYLNSIELLEKRYIHILEPSTGKPVKSRTASVTVIDNSSTMRADALATAFMVIPTDDALRLADRHDIAAYFIILGEADQLVQRPSKAFRLRFDPVQ